MISPSGHLLSLSRLTGTARIIANLMSRKQGHDALRFDLIDEKRFPEYVIAVQKSALKDYNPMIELIQSIFPG